MKIKFYSYFLLLCSSSICEKNLIEKGANIEASSLCGSLLPIVQYLIEKGTNVEEIIQNQRAPLHYASYWDKTDIISKGANKNTKDKDGKTAFNHNCKDEVKELNEKSHSNDFQN